MRRKDEESINQANDGIGNFKQCGTKFKTMARKHSGKLTIGAGVICFFEHFEHFYKNSRC
jgi:hypothetical protein